MLTLSRESGESVIVNEPEGGCLLTVLRVNAADAAGIAAEKHARIDRIKVPGRPLSATRDRRRTTAWPLTFHN